MLYAVTANGTGHSAGVVASANPWAPRFAAPLGGLSGALEAEYFDGLSGIKTSSDKVVVGRFTREVEERVFQGDAIEDKVPFTAVHFRVTESLRGPARVGERLPVEFTGDRQILDLLGEEDTLLFLREKRGDRPGVYRLTNSTGIWTSITGTVESPAVGVTDRGAGMPYAAELERQRPTSFADFVDYVRGLP